MKKYYSFSAILVALMMLFFPSLGKSQSDGYVCGSDQARQRLIEQHPEILLAEKKLEEYTQQYMANYMKNLSSRDAQQDTIILPMVFHIIEQGGPENIPDAQVINEVGILNRDYNLQNTDTSAVIVQALHKVIGDMHLEFRLANKDPNGNCTTGIEHIYSVQTYSGDDYSKLNSWPRQNYLNVWLVSHMYGNAAGYAYYPSDVEAVYNIPAQDGVIILYPYIGSIDAGSVFTSRALTHELGHCFNLEHCWGNTNAPGIACGDDGVADTPITKGWSSCPGTDTSAAKVCNPPDTATGFAGIVENFQNYMEYSYCSVMFTQGQVARALAALTDTIAQRNNLWTQANLALTGIIDTPASPCAPIAAFSPNTRYTCLNDYVTFSDNSYNGTVNSRTWNIPNGAFDPPSTDTSANPKVQFLVAGWQPVSLTVTNSLGSSTKTNNQLLYVGYNNTLYEAPYYEGFDDPSVFTDPSQWASLNLDENATFFSQANYPHTGSGSAMLNNYFATANHDIDEIISPPIDLTPLSETQMNVSFYYSWASGNTNYNSNTDSIVVYGTNNCGVSWQRLWSENAIAVLGYWQGYWTPTNESGVWQKVNISLTNAAVYAQFHKSNVRFMVQIFSSVGGNNFFIDDFSVGYATFPTGIDNISAISNVTLFPNPTAGQFTLGVQLAQAGKVSIKVVDITGQVVIDAYEGQMNDGDNQVELNSSAMLAKGIYIVYIQSGNSTLQRKLVIQ